MGSGYRPGKLSLRSLLSLLMSLGLLPSSCGIWRNLSPQNAIRGGVDVVNRSNVPRPREGLL